MGYFKIYFFLDFTYLVVIEVPSLAPVLRLGNNSPVCASIVKEIA